MSSAINLNKLSPTQSGLATNSNKLNSNHSALASNQSSLNPTQSGLATNSNKLNSTQPTLALNSNKPTQSYLASNQSKLNPSRPSDKLNSNELNLALSQNERALKQSTPSKDLQGVLLADTSDSIGQAIEQSSQATADSAPQTYQLEQTVITATGYEQEAKYAPASISIVPKEEIQSRPIKDIGDIVQDVPGVTLNSFKLGVSQIYIRGMSAEYTLVLVDGKRVSPSKGIDSNGYNSTGGAMPPLSMIERVEVIRGPASLRYGSEAMGDVVNIITKKNPDKTTANITLEGRFQEHRPTWGNTLGFNGNIFHPINDKFSVNLRARVSQSEQNEIRWKDDYGNIKFNPPGYVCTPNAQNKQCANPYAFHALGAYQVVGVGGRLTFTPNEQNSFYFDTDFIFQRINSLNTSPSQFTEVRDYEKLNLVLNHDGKYDFGDISTYLQYNTISRITHGYQTPYVMNYGATAGKRDYSSILYNPTFSATSTFTRNFDFGGAGALIFNAGPSYFYERLYDRGEQTDQNGYQVAVFGEGEYLPLDWLGVVAGVRVNYAKTFGAYAAPRAYLSFYPMSWLTLKMGFASGFQVPDLAYRYDGLYNATTASSTNIYYYGNANLDVEKSFNYEVSALIDTPFANFSFAGYITDYKDAIDSRTFYYGESVDGYSCANNNPGTGSGSISPSCSINVNVAKAQLWGAEFAMNSKALLSSLFTKWNGGIYVDISYAYSDTEQKTGDQKGKPLNDIPLHTLRGKLSYKTPKSATYISYRGNFKHSTSQITPGALADGSIAVIPEYFNDIHIVDLGTSYRFKNDITLGFVVNNLLDKDFTKDYFMWRANFPRTSYGTMLPGRNYWLTLSADF